MTGASYNLQIHYTQILIQFLLLYIISIIFAYGNLESYLAGTENVKAPKRIQFPAENARIHARLDSIFSLFHKGVGNLHHRNSHPSS